MEEAELYPEYRNRFLHRGFCGARNICVLGLQDAPRVICDAVRPVVCQYPDLRDVHHRFPDSGRHPEAGRQMEVKTGINVK